MGSERCDGSSSGVPPLDVRITLLMNDVRSSCFDILGLGISMVRLTRFQKSPLFLPTFGHQHSVFEISRLNDTNTRSFTVRLGCGLNPASM
jgi:hypothetical protein